MINPPIYFLNVFYFVEEPCVERNIRPYIYGTGFCVATYNNCPYREGFVNKLYSLYSFCHFAIIQHFFPFLKIGYKNSIIIRFDPTFFIYLI